MQLFFFPFSNVIFIGIFASVEVLAQLRKGFLGCSGQDTLLGFSFV